MEKITQILNRIDEQVEQPMVTAKFGDNWQEHQKKMYATDQLDTIDLIRVAWIQGRRGIPFEMVVTDLLAKVSEQEKEIDRLKDWKESEMKLWGPVLDYAQKHGEELGIRLGESISEKILQFLKNRLEQSQRIQRLEEQITQMIEWRTNEVKFMNDALDRKQMGVVSEEVTRTTIRAHNITIQHLQSLLHKFPEVPNPTLTKEQMRQQDDLSEQREEDD